MIRTRRRQFAHNETEEPRSAPRTPVGFAGTFDGAGKDIANIYLDQPNGHWHIAR
jgi:hypothetical protein